MSRSRAENSSTSDPVGSNIENLPPGGRLNRRLTCLFGIGLFLIWLAILVRFVVKPGAGDFRPPDLSPPSKSEKIGSNWAIRELDGRPIPFSRYRGRAIVLNFWAPWCEPCLEELPSLGQLAANPRLKDVAILCVSTEDDPESIRRISSQFHGSVPLFRPDGDEALIPFSDGTRRIVALPTTYLIAPDGTVVSVQEGAAQWDDPSVVDALEKLAKRK